MKDTTEILNTVLDELKDRGLLIDDFDDIFGSKSFDEIVEKIKNMG